MTCRRRSNWINMFFIASTSIVAVVLVSCSDTDRSAGRFCGELNAALPALTATLATTSDVDALLDEFRNLNGISPLAIEDQWRALTQLVELAADTDPADPTGRQDLADAAYRTERSAREIEQWVEATCGFQMPDVIGLEGPYVP